MIQVLIFVLSLVASCVVFAAPALAAPTSVPELHDPTQPIEVSGGVYGEEDSSNIAGIKLSGIIFAQDRKIATINGQNLQVGDRINNFLLTEIYPDFVRVKDTSGEFVIKEPYSDVKTPVTNYKAVTIKKAAATKVETTKGNANAKTDK